MICKICGKKLIREKIEESDESVQQYLSCPEHGPSIVVSTSKRRYGRNGMSWLEPKIKQEVLDKALEDKDDSGSI